MSEAITACPVRALRAGLAIWIVDAFFVRASDDPICHHDGTYFMLTEETRDLVTDVGVVPYVGSFGEPALDQIWLVAFIWHDGDSDLRCQIRCRPVEGDRRNGIASEPAAGPLRQPGSGAFDLLHAIIKHLPPR